MAPAGLFQSIALPVLAAALLTGFPSAQDDSDGAFLDHMPAGLERRVGEAGFRGSILIAQGDRVLVRAGFGLADREQGLANEPETRFRLASVSKQFTAAAVLRLVERGVVRYEDHAAEYWPDAPAAWGDVRVIHLLHHTSGIYNVTNLVDFANWMGRAHRPLDLMRKVAGQPLLFAPGESWDYSNSGYHYLAHVIEQSSGSSFESFVAAELFEPLGMKDSGSECTDAPVSKMARGYRAVGDGWAPAHAIDMNVPVGAGGLYSTVDDLWTWARAMIDRTHLDASSWEAMLTPGLGNYGLGVWIEERDGLERVQHSGGINGFVTHLLIIPEPEVVVAVLSNYEGSVDPAGLADSLASSLLAEALVGAER